MESVPSPVASMKVSASSVTELPGVAHSTAFTANDEEMCCVGAAKLLACTAAELLYNCAEKARLVKERFKPVITKREYLSSRCGIME